MKDLDFDELDRAVNSLISGGQPSVATPEPVLNVPTTLVSNDAPSQPPVAPAPSQPLAARRSSGRFMDVVHPSSDMRSSAPVAVVAPVSRIAPTIAPVATPSVSTPVPVEPTTPKSEYPDPIDFQGFNPGVAPTPTPEVAPVAHEDEDSDITKIADDITASLGKDTTTPLESPFIADAKVEKRPLGAFSGDISVDAAVTEPVEEEPTPSVELPVESKDDSDDHPIEKDVPLPAELQNDLLSIEANENPVAAPEAVFTPPAASTDVPVGPTSISQQYSEKPSTGDQPVPTMFAAEAYKKPAAHPKKKSGWFVVLWIGLLIIVGGGIGAAVYFFVLPML
jgi:hypothetical protein